MRHDCLHYWFGSCLGPLLKGPESDPLGFGSGRRNSSSLGLGSHCSEEGTHQERNQSKGPGLGPCGRRGLLEKAGAGALICGRAWMADIGRVQSLGFFSVWEFKNLNLGNLGDCYKYIEEFNKNFEKKKWLNHLNKRVV